MVFAVIYSGVLPREIPTLIAYLVDEGHEGGHTTLIELQDHLDVGISIGTLYRYTQEQLPQTEGVLRLFQTPYLIGGIQLQLLPVVLTDVLEGVLNGCQLSAAKVIRVEKFEESGHHLGIVDDAEVDHSSVEYLGYPQFDSLLHLIIHQHNLN